MKLMTKIRRAITNQVAPSVMADLALISHINRIRMMLYHGLPDQARLELDTILKSETRLAIRQNLQSARDDLSNAEPLLHATVRHIAALIKA